MNSKLLLICFILLLVFTLEWFYVTQAQQQLLAVISTKNNPNTATLMPQFDLNQQPENSYSDLVNRPLFIEGRRPVADNMTAVTSIASDMQWQLSGVYTTRKGLMALLSRSTENTVENKAHRKVIVGAEFDGWTVAGIYNDRIKLMRDNQEKDLPLRKVRKTAAPVKNDIQQQFNSGRATRMRPEPPAESQSAQTPDAAIDNNAHHQ